MKTLLIIFFQCLGLTLFSNQQLKSFLKSTNIPYENNTIILIGLNGNDCINCYKSFTDFIITAQEKGVKNLYFIAGGLTEREKQTFITKNLTNKINTENFILNNEFSYYLNNQSSSVVCIVKNGEIIKKYDSKTLNHFDYNLILFKKKSKIQLIDSLDVSSLIESKQSSAQISKTKLFVLTDYRKGKIYSFRNKEKSIDSIDVENYLNSNYKSILKKTSLDTNAINESIYLQSKMGNYYNGNSVYFIGVNSVEDKVYVSYRLLFNSKYQENGIKSSMLPFVLVLDSNLRPTKNISIDSKDTRDSETVFDVINAHYNSENAILRITDGKSKRDTIMALFKLKNEKYNFVRYYSYKIADHISRIGKNGYPIFHLVNFYNTQKDTFLYTTKDYAIVNINNTSKIDIPFLKKAALNNESYGLYNVIDCKDEKLLWYQLAPKKNSLSIVSSDFKECQYTYDCGFAFNSFMKITDRFFCGMVVNELTSKLYFFRIE